MGIFVPAVAGGPTTAVADVKTLWGPGASAQFSGSGGVSTVVLNDADNSVAAVLYVPKDGPLDRIGVNLSAVTGTPELNLGFVTLDASGNPTATAYGGSAPQAISAWSTGWQWITLTTPATAAAGDRIAARIWPSGAGNVPSVTHTITIRSRVTFTNLAGVPHTQEFATAWTKTSSFPLIAARYSDGVVTPMALSGTVLLGSNFSSSTAPDEQGGLFTLPFSARCFGARVWFDPNSVASTATVKLYDGADALLGSALIDADELSAVTTAMVDVYWDAAGLTKDASYRLTHLATSTDNRQIPEWAAPDTDSKNAVPGGARWQRTTRNAAGAWTNTANTVPILALWLDQITVPA